MSDKHNTMRMALFALAFICTGVAGAADIIVAGGQSTYGYRKGEGFWVQQSIRHEDYLRSNAVYVAGSWDLTDSLSIEAGYLDFGQATNHITFCGDWDYSMTRCRVLTEGWMSSATGHGGTRGLAVSLIQKYRAARALTLYGGLGLYVYETKWKVTQPADGNRQFNVWGNNNWTTAKEPTYLVRAGIQYRSVFVEYIRADDISVSDSAVDHADAVLIGLRVPL